MTDQETIYEAFERLTLAAHAHRQDDVQPTLQEFLLIVVAGALYGAKYPEYSEDDDEYDEEAFDEVFEFAEEYLAGICPAFE